MKATILILILSLISNQNNMTEKIQIELEYDKDSWVEYEVYGFDGKKSYHLQRSKNGMEDKFIFDPEKKIAHTYISSSHSKMMETTEDYSFEKDTQNIKYNFEEFKTDRKEILGYDCYKVVIQDKRGNVTIETYVTNAFSEIPIRHFLNKRFPKLKDFPLEINAPRRMGKAFRIIQKVDSPELLKEENHQDYDQLNKKNVGTLIQDLTGMTYNTFKEKIKGLIKKRNDKK
jgi:hypothetical protein